MNKSELIEQLSTELNLTVPTTSSIVSTIIDSLTAALVSGDGIELRGFGSFTLRKYDSYTGRNPKTGVKTKVKAKKLSFFKIGKELKEAVNAGK